MGQEAQRRAFPKPCSALLSPSRALRPLMPSPKASPRQHGVEEGGGEKGVGGEGRGHFFYRFLYKKVNKIPALARLLGY